MKRSGTITTPDDLDIHWERRGRGAHSVVIPSASWLSADFEGLGDGFASVFYDLRGRGRSTAVFDEQRLGLDRDVADLEQLRAELGLETMSLLGWSYHGLVCARYALEHSGRVERLILVGPSGPCRDPFFHDFLDRFARSMDLDALQELEQMREDGIQETDPELYGRMVHEVFFRAYVADTESLERMKSSPAVEPNLDADRVNDQGRKVLEKLGPYDWRQEFAELQVPTLIIHGEKDPVPLEGSLEWAASLPQAELLRFPGIGHMPWLEIPEVFFPALRHFLTVSATSEAA